MAKLKIFTCAHANGLDGSFYVACSNMTKAEYLFSNANTNDECVINDTQGPTLRANDPEFHELLMKNENIVFDGSTAQIVDNPRFKDARKRLEYAMVEKAQKITQRKKENSSTILAHFMQGQIIEILKGSPSLSQDKAIIDAMRILDKAGLIDIVIAAKVP